MSKDAAVYAEDILESIARIESYTKKLDERNFVTDTKCQDAVIRRLEIIGEAVKSLPEELKAKHPTIPWKKIAGMRDVLIHEYSGVNMKRVWKVISEDLVSLKKEILKMKKEL